MKNQLSIALASIAFVFTGSNCLSAFAAEAPTFTVAMLTPETALKAAQAALGKCRTDGFQTAVAVVDRAGIVQVVLPRRGQQRVSSSRLPRSLLRRSQANQ